MATEVAPDIRKDTLRGVVARNVATGATVSTDELVSYGLLTGDGYRHGQVKHGAKEWSWYDYRSGATHHTNSVESFWKLFKNSVRSTHMHISEKHSPKYLSEFVYLVDHDQLRHDPVLASLIGKLEARRQDCAPLAGKSTLNRLEHAPSGPARYHKIGHDGAAIERLLVDLFLELLLFRQPSGCTVAPSERGRRSSPDDAGPLFAPPGDRP